MGAADFERWCFCDVKNFELFDSNFNLSGRQLGICHAFASRLDRAACGNDPFIAKCAGLGMSFGLGVGIKNELAKA